MDESDVVNESKCIDPESIPTTIEEVKVVEELMEAAEELMKGDVANTELDDALESFESKMKGGVKNLDLKLKVLERFVLIFDESISKILQMVIDEDLKR